MFFKRKPKPIKEIGSYNLFAAVRGNPIEFGKAVNSLIGEVREALINIDSDIGSVLNSNCNPKKEIKVSKRQLEIIFDTVSRLHEFTRNVLIVPRNISRTKDEWKETSYPNFPATKKSCSCGCSKPNINMPKNGWNKLDEPIWDIHRDWPR